MNFLYIVYMISVFLSPNLYYLLTGSPDKFIGLSEIMMPLLCFVNFLYIVIIKTRGNPYKAFFEPPAKTILILLCILYGIGLLGLIATPWYDSKTFTFLLKYSLNIFLFLQLAYLLSYKFIVIGKKFFLIKLFRVLMVITLLIISINLIEIFYPSVIHNIFAYKYTTEAHERFGINRLCGSIASPNTNAIIVYFFGGYILSLLFRPAKTFSKSILIILLLGLSVILILTGSRGGLLAFLAQIVLFWYLTIKRFRPEWRLQVKLLLLLFIFSVPVVFKISEQLQTNLLENLYEVGFTYSLYQREITSIFGGVADYIPPAILERFYFVLKGVSGYWSLPLYQKIFGIGLNASGNILADITGLELSSVHNSFVEYLLLTGIVGFIVFITLTWKVFTYIKERHFYTDIGTILYFFFVGVFVHSFFESNFMFNFKSMQIFLFFFSLYIAERNIIYFRDRLKLR